MRSAPACLLICLICVAPAWAQSPPASANTVSPSSACPDCGVIRSIRAVVKQARVPSDASKPSGLVATVPLGGGKPRVGSSTKIGGDVVESLTTWEVAVRLDDGRFSVLTLDEANDWHEGDKVRIERGKLVHRPD
jgi:hypothetical protein